MYNKLHVQLSYQTHTPNKALQVADTIGTSQSVLIEVPLFQRLITLLVERNTIHVINIVVYILHWDFEKRPYYGGDIISECP